ncbi:MAG: hypothetical protein M1833_006722 [Piccolia ochrophora]|nr:MAG: hypothetical protein M1833_006722 [Piccolia ochrophora]
MDEEITISPFDLVVIPSCSLLLLTVMGPNLSTCRVKNAPLICPWGMNDTFPSNLTLNDDAIIDKHGRKQPWINTTLPIHMNRTWLINNRSTWNETWFRADIKYMAKGDSDIAGNGIIYSMYAFAAATWLVAISLTWLVWKVRKAKLSDVYSAFENTVIHLIS